MRSEGALGWQEIDQPHKKELVEGQAEGHILARAPEIAVSGRQAKVGVPLTRPYNLKTL